MGLQEGLGQDGLAACLIICLFQQIQMNFPMGEVLKAAMCLGSSHFPDGWYLMV